MPLVEVTFRPGTPPEVLKALAAKLPHEVSLAVASADEPYDGDLRPGDVEVRFRELGTLDVSEMDIVVEIRSKWAADRESTAQDRVDALCARLKELSGIARIGVYMTMPPAAWAQT